MHVHFLHVRSAQPDAFPLTLTHAGRCRSWSTCPS
ncbi:hypothetical protein [Microtetraspora glauca]|uniref:Uncharacterized protein n=1 Tax=Microtetraspora glauca TaxID=1996 RepID=A0ABV3GI96_MICGL